MGGFRSIQNDHCCSLLVVVVHCVAAVAVVVVVVGINKRPKQRKMVAYKRRLYYMK